MSTNPLQNSGTLVANKVATTTVYLDDASNPVLNVAHQYAAGSISLSAGANPGAAFSVTPVAQGNTQIFSGPNALISNTLSAPGTFQVGTANVSNALNVTGLSTLIGNTNITGSLTVSGAANVVNNLTVGNTIFVPTILGNAITTSGTTSNVYVETKSAASSNSSALYLSNNWRVKVISSGGLAFQSLLNGSWVNASVVAPAGVSITIANLTTPTS